MKKLVLFTFLLSLGLSLQAQETPTKTWYLEVVNETIFSWGNVKATGLETGNIVRFTPSVNLGVQMHKDFSEKTGFYTGLVIRNVGIITDLNDSVRIKQRTYTLGIPLALKFGTMNGNMAAFGIDNEFAINFKQKVFVNDEKAKTNVWFSDRTPFYLPSAFVELKSKSGNYIRFKYYLTDFLRAENQRVNVAGVNFNPTQSTMMYISVGYAIKSRDITEK